MTDREMLELAAKQASDLAARLDGSEYPLRLSKEMLAEAKAAGLVIVYGASDDLMEFDGAIYDEFGCYDGGTAFVDAQGLLDRSQIDDDEAIADFVVRKRKARTIEAKWCCDGFSWSYQTDIPHATFTVMEDGEPYCRGIVFAIESLTQEQPK